MIGIPVERATELRGADAGGPRLGDRREDLRSARGERDRQRFGGRVDLDHGRVGRESESDRDRLARPVTRRAQQPPSGDLLRQAQARTGDEDRTVGGGRFDAVPAAHTLLVGDPSGIVDDQGRARSAGEHGRHAIAQTVQLLLSDDHQSGLGQPHRRRHQRPHRRVEGERRSADVDDAQEGPVVRIVHGHSAAVPRVLGGFEVLGGEQLDRRFLGQGGADGIRADDRLGPVRSLDEAEAIGLTTGGGGTVTPQDDPIGIGDDEDEGRGVRAPEQDRLHLFDDQPQLRPLAARFDLRTVIDDATVGSGGVEAQAQHSLPRAPDERAWLHRRRGPGDHSIVNACQISGEMCQVRLRHDSSIGRVTAPDHGHGAAVQLDATLLRTSAPGIAWSH